MAFNLDLQQAGMRGKNKLIETNTVESYVEPQRKKTKKE